MFKSKKTYLPILLLLLTFVSVDQWSKIPLGGTAVDLILYALIFICLIIEKKKKGLRFMQGNYMIVGIYLIYAALGILRGCFVAENYWEYKNLVSSSSILLMPLCVYAFSNPSLIQKILKMWFVYALLAYILFFYWVVNISQFYLGPVLLLACFLPLVPGKIRKSILLLLTLALLTYHYQDNRSQFVKAAVALLISLSCIFHKYIPNIALKIVHWLFYAAPVVILYLGLTGVYNIFEETSTKYEGIYTDEQMEDGEVQKIDMSDDTRTFIYQEVIGSAVNHDYVMFGRTPARGNDSYFFYDITKDMNEANKVYNIKHERPQNEVCFPNIFTWLGVVGMVLYILIYAFASFQAVYRSQNFYVKMIGVLVAFNFFYGWIENATNFDILNFCYWILISICLSSTFRDMTDEQFKDWFRSIFKSKVSSPLYAKKYLY